MKNETQVIPFEEIQNNKEKYAKEFSEGSKLLEQTLLMLWENHIETVGCCIGHNDGKSQQYIGFPLSNKEKLIELFSSLDKSKIQISFVTNGDHKSTTIKKYGKNDIFENIIQSLSKPKKDNEIEKIIEKMISRKSNSYFNLHLYYENNRLSNWVIHTTDPEIINQYKGKYEYKELNYGMYQFYGTSYFL